MKYFTFLIITGISLSCQRKNIELDNHGILYSVDTVSIDAKGQFMYLEYDLHQSDYCLQDGFLYNYNGFDHSIEKIDLDRLELVEKFPLQKEGPDGTGSHIFNWRLLWL